MSKFSRRYTSVAGHSRDRLRCAAPGNEANPTWWRLGTRLHRRSPFQFDANCKSGSVLSISSLASVHSNCISWRPRHLVRCKARSSETVQRATAPKPRIRGGDGSSDGSTVGGQIPQAKSGTRRKGRRRGKISYLWHFTELIPRITDT